jgi:peptide/nickel transport system substrate-binding protein
MTWNRIPDTVLGLPSQTPGGIELNDDGSMTVRYQVHPDARWSDGQPITGADLAFTAETMRDLALVAHGAVDPVMAGVTEVRSVENVAWITFDHQGLAFEDALWVILPEHALSDVEIATSDGLGWPSGGPFVPVEGSGGSVMTANPFYWKLDADGRQLPLIEQVSFVPYGNDPAGRFDAGDMDVVELDARGSVDDWIVPDGSEVQRVPSPILEHLTFNLAGSRLDVNPDSVNGLDAFRRSVAHAIAPDALASYSGVYVDESRPGVLVPRNGTAFDALAPSPAAARDALAELENPNPSAVLSTTGNDALRVEVAKTLIDELDATGIELETTLVDSVVYFGDLIPAGSFDIGMWAWINDGSFASTVELLELLDPAGSSAGYSGWGRGDVASENSLRFSELVVQAMAATSREQFEAIVGEAETILATDLPLIPLFHRASFAAVRSDRVSGVQHNATTARLTWNIEQWDILDR